MKLTAHEEYGLRCLLQVARQGVNGTVTISEISRNEAISMPYAAKLLRILRQGGFVRAARGKVGGYTLTLSPDQISVGDALAVLGGRMYEDDFCKHHAGVERSCAHSTQCSIRSLWRALQGALDSILRTTTIHDLLHSDHHGLMPGALQTTLVSLPNRPKSDRPPAASGS
jgi:Rrf2 family protein